MPDASTDHLRLLRLRFLRLPPTWLQLSKSSSGGLLPIELELAVGITDDYGVHVGSFDSVELELNVVDAEKHRPIPSISLSLGKLASSNRFFLSPSQGDFHTLRTTLSFDRLAPKSIPGSICFSLSVVTSETGVGEVEERQGMMRHVGEERQTPVEGWDELHYCFLKVVTGEMELRKPGPLRDKGLISSSKVQTTYRTIHLSSSPQSPIRVLERPGLNNSTGQRLWDAAIVLSFYVSTQKPTVLTSLPSQIEGVRPTKRPKTDVDLRIIELGAGCGLVGLTAASVLSKNEVNATVTLTDIEATVLTTLSENLSLNSHLPSSSLLSSSTLDWGPLPSPLPFSPPNIMVGSDILYNPSSHGLLLETLKGFFFEGLEKALIGYKKRTEGDDGFWELARGEGWKVARVWGWGDVGIWEISR